MRYFSPYQYFELQNNLKRVSFRSAMTLKIVIDTLDTLERQFGDKRLAWNARG
jgi:hypothetical protein